MFTSEKCARPAFEITQILRQTRAKELQIFQNFSATSTQKCVHSVSVRCANSRTLLRPSNETAVRSDPKRHAPDVEITQFFAEVSRKKCKLFFEFRRAAHKKNACIRPACVARTVERRCSCLPSRMCVQSLKKRAVSVHITQSLRRSRAKETQDFQNFGAPRAQNLRALDQRAFWNSQNVVAVVHRV